MPCPFLFLKGYPADPADRNSRGFHMAIIKNGSFIGKIGTVVGCTWKGQHYVRRIPVRTAPPSEKEMENRYIFNLVNQWLKPIQDFVRLGFRNYSPTVWGVNAASSVLHKTALNRDGMNSAIDPALVQLSSGELQLPEDLQLVREGTTLIFSWDPSSGPYKGARDRMILLAYDPENGCALQELSASLRYKGFHSLSVAGVPPGIYHVYVAFIGEDSGQSDSGYVGSLEL